MSKARAFSRVTGLVLLGLAFVLPAVGVTTAGSGVAGSTEDNPNPNALWAGPEPWRPQGRGR
ncbi:hypothetical protein [Thiohalorhabdus sp.]|uniref:hypothetical protein n=1 Tax=Thiohalorhabdus sp. TaxID=3094134 RepID=UPI002FC2C6A8